MNSVGTSIAANISDLKQRIFQACQRSHRSLDEITLILASKTRTVNEILDAYQAGICHFGENYVQEATKKLEQLSSYPLHWHFIGQLQKNKVKNAVGRFCLIHSVDSYGLAEMISKVAAEKNQIQDILVEVNLGEEATKGGLRINEVLDFIKKAVSLPGVRLKGVMGLPPLDEGERSRKYFSLMRSLRDQWQDSIGRPDLLTELSMGTSYDFEYAIEEGATMIRIGSLVFGARRD